MFVILVIFTKSGTKVSDSLFAYTTSRKSHDEIKYKPELRIMSANSLVINLQTISLTEIIKSHNIYRTKVETRANTM